MSETDYRKHITDGDVLVQIGAFDGIQCEQAYGLRNLILNNFHECHLIEPLPDAFEDLKKNYEKSVNQINFYNLAIYDFDGKKDFHVNPTTLTESSFVRHTDCETISVETRTLSTFLKENNIDKIDGLFLDVEGVEDTIIHQLFETTNIRPKVIRYEFPHLKDNNSLEKFITSNGYVIMNCMFGLGDKVCIKNAILKI